MSGGESIIEVNNLRKTFGEITAVDGVSFDVKKGEIFAFLGPNGAGKTTTINILTTLMDRTSGDVRIAGFDPEVNPEEVRYRFGIVFQDQSHDDELTAYENMEYHAVMYGISRAERTKRIEELMKLVELWERRDSYVKTFSGGMKRRLEIARGLIHHPTILYLDEPTLGLDPQTRNYIWNYVNTLSRNEDMTVFFTTHYMEEAELYADRIAVIDHGKIVAVGTPHELMERTGKENLQDAFIELTGLEMREERAKPLDEMRRQHQLNR